MVWWVRNWGSSWLGEPSAPCSVASRSAVAGLESPGQMHSHAWGPGGDSSQGCFLSGGLRASLQGLSSRGIRLLTEWLRLAPGCREQACVPKTGSASCQSLMAMQLLPYSAGRASTETTQAQGGDQTPPHDQRHVGKPAAFSACPRTVENIQSAPSHFFSVCPKYTDISKGNPLHFANLQMRLILLMSALSPFFPLLGLSTASQDHVTGSCLF